MSSLRITALSLVGLVASCGSDSTPPAADVACTSPSLVDLHAFVALGPSDDPFTDRLQDAQCDVAEYGWELFGGEDSFSVDTGACTYLTASQLSLVALKAGDTVRVRVWHTELKAPVAAEAHMALRLGDEVLLDRRIPIPGPSGLDAPTWTAPKDVPAGTPIAFHIHNHGMNSWSLLEVTRTRCE